MEQGTKLVTVETISVVPMCVTVVVEGTSLVTVVVLSEPIKVAFLDGTATDVTPDAEGTGWFGPPGWVMTLLVGLLPEATDCEGYGFVEPPVGLTAIEIDEDREE